MSLFLGIMLVLVAGFFQGSFVLPMTLTKKWEWEHTWAMFSLFGMLIFNWILAFLFIPNIFAIYAAVPVTDIVILLLFGAGWGVGAILFGLGMERLGMALGYPIIMGLISSLGALIPLLVFFPGTIFAPKGLVLVGGTAMVLAGIVLCSVAGSKKRSDSSGSDTRAGSFSAGLIIAVAAGVLSCLPNVGVAFGTNLVDAAKAFGVSENSAGNTVWALIFSVGFIVNFGYCLYLMFRHNSFSTFVVPEIGKNIWFGALMAVMWIGSFYLYGISAVKLGKWGVVAGWPLFMSLSIVVGNLWGIWKGEWKGASPASLSLLKAGIGVLLAATVIIAFSNSL